MAKVGVKTGYRIAAALAGGLFLTAAAAWLPMLADWLVGLNLPASVAVDAAYGIFFILAALVSYALVTELVRARYLTRRCDEVLETTDTARMYDRRFFYSVVEKEILLARRSGWPVSLLALEVVPMKGNSPAGSEVSDKARDAVVAEIRKVMRASDVVGSFTRNEYLLFLPNCPAERVQEVARRLGRRIGSLHITLDGVTYGFLCRAGVASLSPSAAEAKRLIKRAQEALDRAKGRDSGAVDVY
ncbi:GGDEF domain-containing protein [Hydrogenimonas sp.]